MAGDLDADQVRFVESRIAVDQLEGRAGRAADIENAAGADEVLELLPFPVGGSFEGIGVRLGVKTSGCSGMAYVIEFVDELEENDQVFEDHGVKVIVDKKSLLYLDGTEVDYTKEGLNEGFKFNNPNANGECGCGESFTV